MSRMPLTAEQFGWLMSLPPDHPERIAWSGRPEFESMRALYEQFEGARELNVSDLALREAEAELEQRFRVALPSEPGVAAAGSRPAARPARPTRPWLALSLRLAFAMAAVMVVAAAGVWWSARPRSSAVRGAQDAPVILEPRRVAEDLEIRWTPVAGAESYRLSFVNVSMREVAAVEDCRGTRYLLRTSALPPGLEHRAEVILQVEPLRAGVTVGAVGTRSIRVP